MDKNITLQQRIDRAMALRKAGYNCAQCVFMVFDDAHGLSEDMGARLSAGLGGGVGGQHEVCGTITAMSMIVGDKAFNTPADKAAVYGCVKDCSRQFADKNGSIICHELTADRPNRRPCNEYIADTIAIIHNHLTQAN